MTQPTHTTQPRRPGRPLSTWPRPGVFTPDDARRAAQEILDLAPGCDGEYASLRGAYAHRAPDRPLACRMIDDAVHALLAGQTATRTELVQELDRLGIGAEVGQ